MAMDDSAAATSSGAMDIGGMPVGNDEAPVSGNPVLAAIERRSSTRSFAKDAEGRAIPVTDEQRLAVLHAASRAPSAGAMMMYSIIDVREQATLDRLCVLCDGQPMISHAPWALLFVADYVKWIDLFEHVGCFTDEFAERTGKAPRREPGLGELGLALQDTVCAAQNAVIAAEPWVSVVATLATSSSTRRRSLSSLACRRTRFPLACSSWELPPRSALPLVIR